MPQDFLHQLIEFSTRHWWMVLALVVVLVWLFAEEVRGKALSAAQLTPQQLTHGMNREQVVVIDMRDAQIFREGHIINAVNIEASEIERNPQVLEKYKSKSLVLIDLNGMKASALATRLRKQGYENVSVLRGGIGSWKQDSMPLVKGK